MENQEIFGSFKWKVDLLFGLKGDPHSHDCVNYFTRMLTLRLKDAMCKFNGLLVMLIFTNI